MSLLLIDVGNSRVKWALAQGEVWPQQGVIEKAAIEKLKSDFLHLPVPESIHISNVAGEQMEERLRSICALWPCPVDFIAAQAEQCGVRNSYFQPSRLGSDRWAALIAAWQQTRTSCLVVNCGTATTIDALSDEGEFVGGLILPGVDMMRQSMAKGTAQLTGAAGSWHEFPRNTDDAIFSGAIQATVGAIHTQFSALSALGTPRCVLSGGAARSVQLHLSLPVVLIDNLVLRGLQIVAEKTGSR